MYIREVHIENIRSISKFDMKFREGEEAGWHVLIGDNGSGKTTILRCMALGLIGGKQASALRINWLEWIPNYTADEPQRIELAIVPYNNENKILSSRGIILQQNIVAANDSFILSDKTEYKETGVLFVERPSNWFSSGFGPFRRFSGGNPEWNNVIKNKVYVKLASHLSLFGEDIALTEITSWLQKLQFQKLEKNSEGNALDDIKAFINSEDFLPHATQLTDVNSDGIFFTDGNGAKITVNQLSDGYRSILSLTFELIRQLILSYGSEKVFENIRKGEMNIPLPGVVLIDEIDAHLHPTWQTRIGQWFTKYFPNLQFIVTTHSPLVCRACEKGTIWRLAAPGSNQESGEIIGTDRDRLIYGNILDAYGTELFGKAPASFDNSALEKKEELVLLSKKKMAGALNEEEAVELNHLQKIFATDDIVEL